MQFLLYPFAVLYNLVTSVRNRLYDLGYKPSASFEIPVISVGNLTVGGTGKTPMIEYLVRLLQRDFNIATLSRGYGRKTKGFRIASAQESASTVGDEPFQIFKKFDGRFPVVVCEERAIAIPLILDEHPDTEIILLDDAFQHRKVKPAFSILLSDFTRPFYDDYLLPVGRLRESREGAVRADAVVITKAPENLADDQMMEFGREVRKYTDKPVFFTHIRYGLPVAVKANEPFRPKIVLLSAIANQKSFEDYCQSHFEVIQRYNFADHHNYTEKEIQEISESARNQGAIILTTEKDASKLDTSAMHRVLGATSLFFLPIECEFLKDGELFDQMLLTAVGQTGVKKN